ncbi:mono/diheme cytochrome c family protein [Paraburkholderia youngii]
MSQIRANDEASGPLVTRSSASSAKTRALIRTRASSIATSTESATNCTRVARQRLFDDPAGGNCASCHIDQPGVSGAHPLFTAFLATLTDGYDLKTEPVK